MVLVDHPYCFACWMNVPTGMMALEQVCGQDNGLMEPGCHCCYCFYRQIMVMISHNTIRFNCPIVSVPTKDNVLISIDVGVNFHIGREESTFQEDASKFFYNFGPNRLEELLSQEVDEGIRDFVRNTRVHRIRDAKTEIVHSLTQELR